MKKKVWGILFVLFLMVNLLAWHSASFCDFYIEKIFPVLGGMYSMVTSIFPFSLGEWMLAAAVLFVVWFGLTAVIRTAVKKDWSRKLFLVTGRAFAWIFLAVMWVMTCNCFIQYHATEFEEKYFEQVRSEGYSREELAVLRDYIVVNLNELALQMERDERGYLVYSGDMHQTAVEAMQRMGEKYPQLAGYYPEPKEIFFSDLLSQTHMMGYFFPFSMEANYNSRMYVVNKPSTICHELSHLKGFLQEDEANLIGYLACVDSDDLFFKYSGFMGVLNYVEREFQNSIGKSAAVYQKHPAISEQVYQDCIFLTKEAWQEVEEKAVVSTKTAKKVSNAATTATLKLNGVEEGMKSYRGVVKLLLDYYDGVLFGNVYMTVDAEAAEP